MSGKEKPAVTRAEACGRAGRKKAARSVYVVQAAAAADYDKLAPSGQTQIEQRDSRKAGQEKTGGVEGSKGERKYAPSCRPEPMNDDRMDAPRRSQRLLNKGGITSYTGLAAIVANSSMFTTILVCFRPSSGPVQALKIHPGILSYVSLSD